MFTVWVALDAPRYDLSVAYSMLYDAAAVVASQVTLMEVLEVALTVGAFDGVLGIDDVSLEKLDHSLYNPSLIALHLTLYSWPAFIVHAYDAWL